MQHPAKPLARKNSTISDLVLQQVPSQEQCLHPRATGYDNTQAGRQMAVSDSGLPRGSLRLLCRHGRPSAKICLLGASLGAPRRAAVGLHSYATPPGAAWVAICSEGRRQRWVSRCSTSRYGASAQGMVWLHCHYFRGRKTILDSLLRPSRANVCARLAKMPPH